MYSKLTSEYHHEGTKGPPQWPWINSKRYSKFILIFFFLLLANFVRIQFLEREYFDTFTNNVTSALDPRRNDPLFPTEEDLKNKIVMAVVVCSKPGDTQPRKEAAVMIKSLVISSTLYAQSNTSSFKSSPLWWVELHLFLEHNQDVDYFIEQLVQFGYPFPYMLVDLHFHSAKEAIPEKFQTLMILDPRFRCMYVRDFLQTALHDVDSVLYVDTDVIFTGNLMTVWDYRLQMKGEQLIAVAPDSEGNNPTDSHFFKKIPIPPPKGLNSGILLMNLTRMRNSTWESRVLQIYQDYSVFAKAMNDQMLLNVLLYYDSGLLLRMPCHYNFWFMHCYDGYYCPDANEDPVGIQVIHGASSAFLPRRQFYHIFSQYEAINLTLTKEGQVSVNFIEDLMLPIREAYRDTKLTNYSEQEINFRNHKQCDGTIDKVLFKKYFVQE